MPTRLILIVIAATVALWVGAPAAAATGAASARRAPSAAAAPSTTPALAASARRAPSAAASPTATPARFRSAVWTPPVPGPPTRLFDLGPNDFARGQHRGVDLDAAAGERVRSACPGRVVFAGRVAGVGTVSVRCGPWRVTYAPLGRIVVKAGARVGAGRGLGRISGGEPLHLGVRRESDRFGYVDPLPFLSVGDRAPPPVLPARRPPGVPRARALAHPARPSPSPSLAPWPVWVGLALLMTGLAGTGTLRLPLRKPGGAACRASSTSSSSPMTRSSP